MKNIFLISVSALFANLVTADANKVAIKINVPGVGVAQLTHENLGEPIGAPARITVTVKCKKSGQLKEVALYRGCKLESHTFETDTKTLSLKILAARVVFNTGDVVCDQVDDKTVELRNVCD